MAHPRRLDTPNGCPWSRSVANRLPIMADCLFCEIVAGSRPAEVIWADDLLVAFLDARPVFKGHTLLVPREHVATLPDLPAAVLLASRRR